MKKTERQAYRIAEEDKVALQKIADIQLVPSGTIVSALVKQYITAVNKYGNKLTWPPEFHTSETLKIQEDIDKRDAFEKIA